ncbi:MAG TPA: 3-oxo-tetronate kinase [Chthoniobacterales bacterium]|nr:3-oxo-tetronate kinase [Chthoniobacterales bacterium]
MPLLGCIADDFTGGTDLANNLVKSGFRTVQTLGIPHETKAAMGSDAVVVALKTRTCPAELAVGESLQALGWLRSLGCKQFYFKYCSTFDSTHHGNIGPVIDALLPALGCDFTVACPAFPDNGRTVYRGHLFVHDVLLSESGMQNHPLTPMTDPNLVRFLSTQTSAKVGLIRFDSVSQGSKAVVQEIQKLRQDGVRIAITDCLGNTDLVVLGSALKELTLVTGGSGLALGLAANFGLSRAAPVSVPAFSGNRAILAGSCSKMTLRQIERAKPASSHRQISVRKLAEDSEAVIRDIRSWATEMLSKPKPLLIYTSETVEQLTKDQNELGIERTGSLCEHALAEIASSLVNNGVTQLIVAGGETSGAVVKRLGLDLLEIGPEIDPGVPWTLATGSGKQLALALKSGNFGAEDFLTKAWEQLS